MHSVSKTFPAAPPVPTVLQIKKILNFISICLAVRTPTPLCNNSAPPGGVPFSTLGTTALTGVAPKVF